MLTRGGCRLSEGSSVKVDWELCGRADHSTLIGNFPVVRSWRRSLKVGSLSLIHYEIHFNFYNKESNV
jgi:hypothetical protein